MRIECQHCGEWDEEDEHYCTSKPRATVVARDESGNDISERFDEIHNAIERSQQSRKSRDYGERVTDTIRIWNVRVGQTIMWRERERTVCKVFRHDPYVSVTFIRVGGCQDADDFNKDKLVELVIYDAKTIHSNS